MKVSGTPGSPASVHIKQEGASPCQSTPGLTPELRQLIHADVDVRTAASLDHSSDIDSGERFIVSHSFIPSFFPDASMVLDEAVKGDCERGCEKYGCLPVTHDSCCSASLLSEYMTWNDRGWVYVQLDLPLQNVTSPASPQPEQINLPAINVARTTCTLQQTPLDRDMQVCAAVFHSNVAKAFLKHACPTVEESLADHVM